VNIYTTHYIGFLFVVRRYCQRAALNGNRLRILLRADGFESLVRSYTGGRSTNIIICAQCLAVFQFGRTAVTVESKVEASARETDEVATANEVIGEEDAEVCSA